jgi:quercetin dioxygenase-like cupin family protein
MADKSIGAEFDGVRAVSELVQVQPGTVVSRTIVKKPAGTVTAFAFDAGEGLSEHTAAFDALVLGIEGQAELTVAGTRSLVGAGQVLRLPAGQPHALKALSAFKMLLVMIRD